MGWTGNIIETNSKYQGLSGLVMQHTGGLGVDIIIDCGGTVICYMSKQSVRVLHRAW